MNLIQLFVGTLFIVFSFVLSAGKPRVYKYKPQFESVVCYICAVWTGSKYGRRHGPCK
jgi:hypothetical protein